jgi:hypothetical protein
LFVREGRETHRFRYSKQPYFPITQPDEAILLPIRRGLFGARVLDLATLERGER